MKYRVEVDRDICSLEYNFPASKEGLLNAITVAACWAQKDYNKITICRTKSGEVLISQTPCQEENKIKEMALELLL